MLGLSGILMALPGGTLLGIQTTKLILFETNFN